MAYLQGSCASLMFTWLCCWSDIFGKVLSYEEHKTFVFGLWKIIFGKYLIIMKLRRGIKEPGYGFHVGITRS